MDRAASRLVSLFLGMLLLAPQGNAGAASVYEPPRFEVAAPVTGTPLTFVVYGDTRFSRREKIVNAPARRALVGRIARENPAAILIGGDLVYEGTDPDDYATYESETLEWAKEKIPVFPARGNRGVAGCTRGEAGPRLESWWRRGGALALRPYRWYSVSLGP